MHQTEEQSFELQRAERDGILTQSRYQDILVWDYTRRAQHQNKYSLRAYAQFLGLSASMLSEVWNGKAQLSLARAQEISRRMALDPVASQYFRLLVELQTRRSPVKREKALRRVERLLHQHCPSGLAKLVCESERSEHPSSPATYRTLLFVPRKDWRKLLLRIEALACEFSTSAEEDATTTMSLSVRVSSSSGPMDLHDP